MTTFENISVKFVKPVTSGTGIKWDVYQIERRTPIGTATTTFVARSSKKRKLGEVIKLAKLVITDDECPKLVDAVQ